MQQQIRFIIYLLISGAATSFAVFLIGLSVRKNSVDLALRFISDNMDSYLMIAGSSGVAWVVLGAVWKNIIILRSISGYLIAFLMSSVLIGPCGILITAVGNHIFYDRDIDSSVFNPMSYWSNIYNDWLFVVLNLLRGSALMLIVWKTRAVTNRSIAEDRRNFPNTMLYDEPNQVTRILCGQAFLGGNIFRQQVIGFFDNKWTAVAPEYGLNTQLICSVCEFADVRDRMYAFKYIFVALLCFILYLSMPEFSLIVFVVLSAGVRLWKVNGDIALSQHFRKSSFRLDAAIAKYAAWQSDSIRRSLPPTDQNVIVYKGFSPFVGTGLDMDGWSVVTRIDKPNAEKGIQEVRGFDKKDIYSALQLGISSLDLKNVTCEDVIFVRGLDIRENSHFMGDVAYRPTLTMPETVFDHYFDENRGIVRGYKRIQFTGWGGDIIITMFVRFSIEGKNLILELKKFLLPPISNKMRRVDATPPDRLGLLFSRFLASLVVGPLQTLVSPIVVLGEITKAIGKALRNDDREADARRKLVEDNLSFDHGANATLREIFAQGHFAHYFQKADFDSVSKLIERRLLNVVEDFLEDHGVDPSDFRDRQTSILNSGIIVQGGDVRAETLAVGQGAKANKVENHRSVAAKESL